MKSIPWKNFACTAAPWAMLLTSVMLAQPAPAPTENPAPAVAPAAPGIQIPDTAPVTPAATGETKPAAPASSVEIKVEAGSGGLKPVVLRNGRPTEFPLGSHVVPQGSIARDSISVLGSTTVEGEVEGDAVAILGSTTLGPAANVRGAAVAVIGRLYSEGAIREEAVSVLGGAYIDGHVGKNAVVVLGNMDLGPHAVVDGDVVIVGGSLTKATGAVVRGTEVHVPLLGSWGDADGLATWVKRCVVFGRPLAFGPHLAWVWIVASAFLGLYMFVALLFPRGIMACAETLETRPGFSVLTSFLAVLVTPVVVVVLALTVVGALLVPFLGLALIFAKLVGQVVMLAWLGRRFTKFFGDGPLGHPVFAVLVGGVIGALLYTVPVLGFLCFALFHWLGLGVVVYTVLRRMKREPRRVPVVAAAPAPLAPAAFRPELSAAPAPSPRPAVVPLGIVAASAPSVSAGFTGRDMEKEDRPLPPTVAPVTVPPVVETLPVVPPMSARPEEPGLVPPVVKPVSRPVSLTEKVAPEAAWPRAGFFVRLGAMGIDGVLVGLILTFVYGFVPRGFHLGHGPGGWFLFMAIYGAVMWKNKGTTIGGIVCGLKVVRTDQRELDWPTAIVRALGCFLSLAVAGLGFIWVAIDDERLSWHDKIAGTTVVHVPKGESLL